MSSDSLVIYQYFDYKILMLLDALSDKTNVVENTPILCEEPLSHSDSMTNLVTSVKPLTIASNNTQLDISNTPLTATTAAHGPVVLLTAKNHPQNNVFEIHPNRRQVSNFPDFSNTIIDLGMFY